MSPTTIARARPTYRLHQQFLRLRRQGTSTPFWTSLANALGPLHYWYYWQVKKPVHLIHAQSLSFGDNALLLPLIMLHNCVSASLTTDTLEEHFCHPAQGHYAFLTSNVDPWDYRFSFEAPWVLTLHQALTQWIGIHQVPLSSLHNVPALPEPSQFDTPVTALKALYQWIFTVLAHYRHAFFIDWHLDKRPRTLFGYFAHAPQRAHERTQALPSHQQKAHDLLRELSTSYQCACTPFNSSTNIFILASSQLHFCSHVPSVLKPDAKAHSHFYARAAWDSNDPNSIHQLSQTDIFKVLHLSVPAHNPQTL